MSLQTPIHGTEWQFGNYRDELITRIVTRHIMVSLKGGINLGEANIVRCIKRCLSQADALQWRHNGRDGVSDHQPHYCLLNHLFRRRSKKTSKLRVTGLCVTGEFPAQRASNMENISIWWRHHGLLHL